MVIFFHSHSFFSHITPTHTHSHFTPTVEQVAASGGYMMSCVADKIVASPFAVLGSIGVISEIPNFYERLKEEGMYVWRICCID
mmetsp:Transcript_45729/g.111464  ORF Transcript_45729/g.111464 Transcript_45729/m.111464 type:complete len:84 (+) Transcript_45729:1669-1920(+)